MITEMHAHCPKCNTSKKCTVTKYITDWLKKLVIVGYKCQTCKSKWQSKSDIP